MPHKVWIGKLLKFKAKSRSCHSVCLVTTSKTNGEKWRELFSGDLRMWLINIKKTERSAFRAPNLITLGLHNSGLYWMEPRISGEVTVLSFQRFSSGERLLENR